MLRSERQFHVEAEAVRLGNLLGRWIFQHVPKDVQSKPALKAGNAGGPCYLDSVKCRCKSV